MNILSYHDFINEARKKRSDSKHPYFKGLSKTMIKAKKKQMKAQTKMSDSDPSAYKEMPGDKKAKETSKKSKHTSNYEEMYGE